MTFGPATILHAIDLVAILEVKEWIVVDVTVKMNSRSKRKVSDSGDAKKVRLTLPSSTTDTLTSARV